MPGCLRALQSPSLPGRFRGDWGPSQSFLVPRSTRCSTQEREDLTAGLLTLRPSELWAGGTGVPMLPPVPAGLWSQSLSIKEQSHHLLVCSGSPGISWQCFMYLGFWSWPDLINNNHLWIPKWYTLFHFNTNNSLKTNALLSWYSPKRRLLPLSFQIKLAHLWTFSVNFPYFSSDLQTSHID